MRMLGKILAGSATAATLVALTAGPALADPPVGTTPRATDAVASGSNTTQYVVDQLSHDYNNMHKTATTKLYSFDAVNPFTLAIGDNITTKANCAQIARPNGSSAGIAAMDANAQPSGDTTHYCLDFARSSRPRGSSDPPYAANGVAFTAFAGDAVTYATRTAAAGGTNAPSNLSAKQLKAIFTCADTNWNQVGGPNAPIHAFLPQSGSGTLSFWLLALGGGVTPITPGPCVSNVGNTLEENEGINAALNDPNAIFIYSVGAYLAQKYHSPNCTNADCSPVGGNNPPCTPGTGQNMFGCNETGVLGLNEIQGTKPTAPFPLPAPPCNTCHISTTFDKLFQRTLYNVVRYDPNTSDHIPGGESGAPGGLNLEQFFSSTGFICTNSKAKTDIHNYGFLSISNCGATN